MREESIASSDLHSLFFQPLSPIRLPLSLVSPLLDQLVIQLLNQRLQLSVSVPHLSQLLLLLNPQLQHLQLSPSVPLRPQQLLKLQLQPPLQSQLPSVSHLQSQLRQLLNPILLLQSHLQLLPFLLDLPQLIKVRRKP